MGLHNKVTVCRLRLQYGHQLKNPFWMAQLQNGGRTRILSKRMREETSDNDHSSAEAFQSFIHRLDSYLERPSWI